MNDDVDQLTPARSSTVNCDVVGHSSATSSGSTCDDVDQLTPVKSSTVNCDVIGHSSATFSGSACDVVDQLTPAKSSTVDCDVIGHLSATPSGSACDEATFSDLRYLVADWYETREKINKLRILLRDVLKNDNVNKIKDCLEFFEKLYAVGKLHSKNLTIIYELIKCTGDLGLERKIREIVPSCPNIRDIAVAEISMFRLKLQDFGNMLCESDVNAIDGLYNLPRKKYKDAWCLIIDLEYRGLIREGSLEDFIKKLEKHSLGHAAAKLR